MVLIKLTILMIYRRVFVPRRWTPFDMVLRAFESILILFYTAITIVKIVECTPRERIWNKSVPENVSMYQLSSMAVECLIL